jgi:hypothetical protein
MGKIALFSYSVQPGPTGACKDSCARAFLDAADELRTKRRAALAKLDQLA